MLRFVSTYSRTVLLSNNILLRSTRSFANQEKIVQVQSTDNNSKTRRIPLSNTRRLNVKKLFSDEDSNETVNPPNPRRPNVVHSTSFEDPSRLVSNLSTQTRYENDIASVNDFENEERRRRTDRQNQVKMSDIEQQSKRKTSQKKFIQKFDIPSSNADGSDYIATNKKNERKFKSKENQSSQTDSSVASKGSDQPSLYSSQIQNANTIEDIFKILDKYVIPTEFALGLQRLCQLASEENTNAIQSYAQLENNRQRLESLLLAFTNKFSDHEILTAITFVSKYYPEDNDFTEKFSLSLSARLRRINVHQIVRILEELKSSRHTAQWIHRIYNRLLSLAEGRYFEFDNIRDILALTHKISYNDRLIQRLDERILELTDNLTFDDWFKILINKSMLKRRDRTIIRAACYHLLKLSESFVFPLEKIKDCLLACAMLNVHDKNFLERLVRDAFEQVKQFDDPFILQSIVTSMGTLRLRHCELLDAFGRVILEDINKFQTSIPAFIRTCAAVNYSPAALPKIVQNHFRLDEIASIDTNQLNDLRNRIDLVWSLAILDQANQNHVQSVLNQDIFQQIQNEVSNSKIASALKLLAIYSYSIQKFSTKFLKPTFNVEQLAQQVTLKNSNAQDQLAKTITTFAAENQYSKFSVVTSNMIVLDCLMVVDQNGTPQDLNTVLTNGDSNATNGQTTFNKVRIDQNRFKVAIKCLDYQDKTLLTNSVSGSIALQLRLLNSLGYKCVPIHYDEFMKIQVPNDRIKYVQRKINEAIKPSSTSMNK